MRREAPKSCHLLQHRTITNPTKPETTKIFSKKHFSQHSRKRDTKVPKLLKVGLAQFLAMVVTYEDHKIQNPANKQTDYRRV